MLQLVRSSFPLDFLNRKNSVFFFLYLAICLDVEKIEDLHFFSQHSWFGLLLLKVFHVLAVLLSSLSVTPLITVFKLVSARFHEGEKTDC